MLKKKNNKLLFPSVLYAQKYVLFLQGILLNLTIDKKNLTDWEMYPFYNLQSPDLALQTSFLKK